MDQSDRPQRGSIESANSLIDAGILCAVITGVTGLVLPVVAYMAWSALHPNRGVQDFSGLIAVVLATTGVIGGAVVGFLAGMLARAGARMTASFLALGVVHFATYVYLTTVSLEPSLASWVALPVIAIEIGLSIVCWRKKSVTGADEGQTGGTP